MAQTESMSVVTLDPVLNKMDVKESNSGKKLKQARLPFMPIDHEQKTLKTITPPGSKKRKLSDNDSPSAKQAKVSAKPVKPLSPNGDAEVSSSSEAEVAPLGGHQKGVKKISTLDRFLYKKRDVQEQEEISSTNDCVPMAIDLTDETENDQVDSAVNKYENSSATEITADDKEAESSNKQDEVSDERTSEEKTNDKKDLENCSKTDPDEEKTKVGEKTEKLRNLDKENKENIEQDVVCVEDNEEVNQSFVSDTSVCEAALKTPAKNNPLVSVLKTPLVELKKDVSSPVAQAASVTESPGTTSDATPKSGKKKSTKPISESKRKEKEAIKLQKDKEKEEKRLQKEKEREEKEKERLEKKRQKDEEKAEKERQKQEEKDKKEKERLEKLQKKEEEKKKKEEMIEAKTEEKRKKEEEKKQKEEEKKLKEEEKQKEEEEKLKKKEKIAQSFKSFFIEKTPVVSPPKTKESKSQFFMPFEMKPNMRLAPAVRVDSLSEEVKTELDQSLMKQDSEDLYLKQLKSKAFRRRKSKKTYPRELTEDKDIEIMCHDAETIKKTLHKVKFLKFAENNRPPYYGTWTKPTTVLSARNPFKQDEALFDYEVDSDDEWEEEDPGESVSSDEEDDDKDKDKDEDEEDADGWMVPHGYLSDDEGIDNEDEMDASKKHQLQAARQEAWEREIKMQTQPLKMIAVGCVWEQETLAIAAKQLEKLLSFKAVCLREGPIPTSLSRSEGDTTMSESEKNDEKLATPRPGLKKSVPEEAMPDLIRLLHGNPSGVKKLVKEFRMYWKLKTTPTDSSSEPSEAGISSSTEDRTHSQGDGKETPVPAAADTSMEVDERSETPSTPPNDTSKTESQVDFAISKRQLEIKIPAIAVREKRADNKVTCWYVKDDILKQYGMEDIQLPNTWEYAHVKAPLWASSNKATPKTEEIAANKSAPTSGRATPTIGIPNIMQFAQTMSPAQIQAQQAIASPIAAKLSIKNVDTETTEANPDMETEELPPVPKDQISIKNFFKLATNGPKPAVGKVVGNTSKIADKTGDKDKKAESMGTNTELAKASPVLASILTTDNAGDKKAAEVNSSVNTSKNDVLKVKPIKRNSAIPLEKVVSPPRKMLKVTPISPKVIDVRTDKDNDKTQSENKPPAAEPMETDVIVLD